MKTTERGRPKKVVPLDATKTEYTISLRLGSQVIVGKGTTPLDALRSMETPEKITEKGIITITCGEKKKEMLFMPLRLRRLFYPNAQPILVKWLALGL